VASSHPGAGDPARVLVADAEPVFQAGVVAILAAAGIHAEPVAPDRLAGAAPRCDAVVLDSRLGEGAYSWDLVAALVARSPRLAIVVTADRVRGAGILRVMEAGARALVHRRCSPREMAAATASALRGTEWVSAPLAALLRDELLAEASGEPVDDLTAREREVLAGLASGGSNAGIARALGISEHTVRNHVHALMAKLGAGNRTDALVIAARRGLVDLDR
jgi:DNA-binding NarL/FixJ family response regulator